MKILTFIIGIVVGYLWSTYLWIKEIINEIEKGKNDD